MSTHFHVTSVSNRESIGRYGLDWRRMGAARGIAGSREPEQQGCFIAVGSFERDWFVRMNNTGGAVDVWEVSGVRPADLVTSPEGFLYIPGVISPDRLLLVQRDLPPTPPPRRGQSKGAYSTSLTITFDDVSAADG